MTTLFAKVMEVSIICYHWMLLGAIIIKLCVEVNIYHDIMTNF